MRRFWRSETLRQTKRESFLRALLTYDARADHQEVGVNHADLVGSLTDDGRQAPIIDLDFPHRYEPSQTEGHAHLYLDVPVSRIRWVVLMLALRYARVTETGYTVWSLRRGQNFVRYGWHSTDGYRERSEALRQYGWFRRRTDE